MTKRIAAIVFILFCTSLAWMILGGTIVARTDDFSARLKGRVTTTWGTPQVQSPPQATYSRTTMEMVERTIDGKKISERASRTVEHVIPLDGSDIQVALRLEHRQKGLLWYSTYTVDYSGKYRYLNSSNQEEHVSIRFKFPAERAIYDDFRVLVDGKPVPARTGANGAIVGVHMAAAQSVEYAVSYRSQGLQSWTYRFGSDVNQIRNFSLQMQTDFDAIDFPDNTLSPTEKESIRGGWLRFLIAMSVEVYLRVFWVKIFHKPPPPSNRA